MQPNLGLVYLPLLVQAEMRPDDVEPYNHMGIHAPFVVTSDHPRDPVGTRLDWGKVQSILGDGWNVMILAQDGAVKPLP